MGASILYYSFQAILYILWMVSFHFIFKPRFRPALTAGLTILTFFLFALTSSMTRQQSVLRVISCTLLVLLTMQLIFRGKWYHKLAFSIPAGRAQRPDSFQRGFFHPAYDLSL